jgi:SAM-dependent methyltransferase
VIDALREALVGAAVRTRSGRRLMAATGRELSRAARVGEVVAEARHEAAAHPDSMYDGAYFGAGRDPSGDRHGHSGYARYDRVASNADIAAFLLWRHFRVQRVLDVGCATGFLVEALRERGLDAEGCDASVYAVEHATPGALGYVRLGDPVRGLPYGDGAFDLVCALEILEHLAPADVPAALAELRRVCGGVCYATIPSFGDNPAGPHGFFDGKVRPERLEHYRALGDSFAGPVPEEDLARDADGRPVEGHLTIASFGWWTARFADAGFVAWPEVARRLYDDIEPVGLERFWNLYVFALPDVPDAVAWSREPQRSLPELGLHHPLFEHAAAQARQAQPGG